MSLSQTMMNNERAAKGYQKISTNRQRSFGMKLAKNIAPCPGGVILDLGCGTGELSAYLTELVGRDGQVVAVDPDVSRVKLAQESHEGISNLKIYEGSASNFPRMGTECYDIVFSNFVLHWIQDKQEAFRNMYQSLKPGGKIVISFNPVLPESFHDAFQELNPQNLGRLMSNYHCESRSKVEEICTAEGFEIVESYAVESDGPEFEDVESMIYCFWATTHGVFDPKLITKDKLSSFCARHTSGEHSKPLKVFVTEGEFVSVLIAAKPPKS